MGLFLAIWFILGWVVLVVLIVRFMVKEQRRRRAAIARVTYRTPIVLGEARRYVGAPERDFLTSHIRWYGPLDAWPGRPWSIKQWFQG